MPTEHIFQVFRLVNSSVIDSAFLLACLILARRPGNPPYLRQFLIFGIANFISDWIQVYYLDIYNAADRFSKLAYILTQTIHFLYPIFEIIFFFYILFQIVKSLLAKRIAKILAVFFIVSYLFSVYMFISQSQTGFLYWISVSFFFKDVALVSLCLFFFVEIFKDTELLDLSRFPAFWIVTGILFYYSIETLTMFFAAYFFVHNMVLLKDVIISVSYIPAIIVFLMFIKAFTCRIRL
jgi:hypothetical protein